ncbi:MAG: hypothetical protein ACOVP8_04415 [Phycisphaerales bacterium]
MKTQRVLSVVIASICFASPVLAGFVDASVTSTRLRARLGSAGSLLEAPNSSGFTLGTPGVASSLTSQLGSFSLQPWALSGVHASTGLVSTPTTQSPLEPLATYESVTDFSLRSDIGTLSRFQVDRSVTLTGDQNIVTSGLVELRFVNTWSVEGFISEGVLQILQFQPFAITSGSTNASYVFDYFLPANQTHTFRFTISGDIRGQTLGQPASTAFTDDFRFSATVIPAPASACGLLACAAFAARRRR